VTKQDYNTQRNINKTTELPMTRAMEELNALEKKRASHQRAIDKELEK
jgi:hypothetical protein